MVVEIAVAVAAADVLVEAVVVVEVVAPAVVVEEVVVKVVVDTASAATIMFRQKGRSKSRSSSRSTSFSSSNISSNTITGENGGQFSTEVISFYEGVIPTITRGSLLISLRRITTWVIPLRNEMAHGSFCRGGSFLFNTPARTIKVSEFVLRIR